jgi:hypothetical protein
MSYNLKTLLGKRGDILLDVMARQLIEALTQKGSSKNLLLALGFKPTLSNEAAKEILQIIKDHL